MDAPLRQYLGWEGFPENLTEPEVVHFFSLSVDIQRTVQRHRRPLNRLGVALQIGFLRLTGALLNSVEMIPPPVLAHLGTELGIAPPRLASIRALYRRRRTLFEHQAAAKQALGLNDLTEHGERALNGLAALFATRSREPPSFIAPCPDSGTSFHNGYSAIFTSY
jgi:hypothetical protein